jgi:tripartite-type tricarboxylate transporter receptor subunit TctC
MKRPELVFLALMGLAAAIPARAADFYAGKTITLSTHTSPGGGYDTYLRLFAAHFGNHVPGHPTVIVINQPGAGGLTAINYAGRIAPRDGTFLTLVSEGILLQQVTGGPGLRVSLDDLNWIGNFVKSPVVIVTWYTSKVKTLADAKARVATLGTTGAGAISEELPLVVNALVGTKFKLIRGYPGASQMIVAMERGEIDGRGAAMWASYKVTSPNEIRDHKFNPIIQFGLRKEPALEGVPLLGDLVKDDPEKAAIARFVALAEDECRPLAAPPGVDAARVAILRRAFDATMKDPAFLADAKRARMEISPSTGEEVEADVHEVLTTPKAIVEETKPILALP